MRKPSRIYESLTEEDFVKLLSATRKKHHKIIFMLAYGSGLRLSEIVNLSREDIDLKKHTIHVRQGKGSKDRIVNTPKWLRLSHMGDIPIKIKKRAIESAFIRNSFKCGINRVVDTFQRKDPKTEDIKSIPINRFHFHCLRHSFATRALESGVPINQVQLLLGHNNLSTTSRYLSANPIDAITSIIEKGV